MAGFMNDPLASLGMGLLSGNYGSNSKEAFANAMRGGLLGMQQAGVNQSRQAQNQIAQQQLLMQQAAAKRKIEEDKAFEQWVNSLPPQEQAMARGNPELYRAMMTQKYQQQYAPPQRPTEAPSNIREWQAFQAMTPQQQQQYSSDEACKSVYGYWATTCSAQSDRPYADSGDNRKGIKTRRRTGSKSAAGSSSSNRGC